MSLAARPAPSQTFGVHGVEHLSEVVGDSTAGATNWASGHDDQIFRDGTPSTQKTR
jgi:hypothetical protein